MSVLILAAALAAPQQIVALRPPVEAPAPASPVLESNGYAYDDGVGETLFGVSPAADLCWMQSFDAVGGADTITSIATSFGLFNVGPPDGSPVTLCVWDDPDGDGRPYDAVLLARVDAQVQQSATGVIVSYPIPPTTVSGSFFVGAFMTLSGPVGAPAVDEDTFLLERSWLAAAASGTFDPTQIFPGTTLFSLSALGYDNPLLLRAEGSGASTYCMAKLNSLGCMPSIGSTGRVDPTASSGFTVYSARVRSNRVGLLCYSLDGRAATPFQGGTLCLATPLRRTPPVNSGGNATADCSGVFAIDMNAFASGALGGTPAPELSVPGTTVDVQWWGRDKGDPAVFGTTLSNALEYVVPGTPVD